MEKRLNSVEDCYAKCNGTRPTEIVIDEISYEGVGEMIKIKNDLNANIQKYVAGMDPISTDGLSKVHVTLQDLKQLTNEVLPEQIFFE